mgnify:CR=1 FL=1
MLKPYAQMQINNKEQPNKWVVCGEVNDHKESQCHCRMGLHWIKISSDKNPSYEEEPLIQQTL